MLSKLTMEGSKYYKLNLLYLYKIKTMCLPEFYAFLCHVLGVISLTILVKILGIFAVKISIDSKTCKNMEPKCDDFRRALHA